MSSKFVLECILKADNNFSTPGERNEAVGQLFMKYVKYLNLYLTEVLNPEYINFNCDDYICTDFQFQPSNYLIKELSKRNRRYKGGEIAFFSNFRREDFDFFIDIDPDNYKTYITERVWRWKKLIDCDKPRSYAKGVKDLNLAHLILKDFYNQVQDGKYETKIE
ncbi:hypothetical protein COX58_02070 [archaeon CG_4_10_14_0_2_um_filter_Archaea_38_6]|nr:MAG: hypothetical protein COS83_04510 [archaeon CG07_land_8_20_14_0_80_38_8]PIU89236.1 MAG: hypothetical protein COS64_01470 [archaeon CG06_land_8_20_14_3_00_37_11]PIX43589.1 MAG: hypothetical protein COZ55_01095 [archaeon CG_4_8_14_3_um_filter_38_5]PJA22499.1 MAG: hypothetical protein COX58_02070 [archaeon CG_4_10_14_0_2_um_filter_Archaea_38_6]